MMKNGVDEKCYAIALSWQSPSATSSFFAIAHSFMISAQNLQYPQKFFRSNYITLHIAIKIDQSKLRYRSFYTL